MPSYYVLGAAYGLVVQVYANAIRKVPAFRRPWEHMLLMGVGAWTMDYVGKWTIKAQEQYDANRQKMITAHQMPLSSRYT